ncbi:MAG: CBU_0592 family membrane protein [Novosphingobium sp.]
MVSLRAGILSEEGRLVKLWPVWLAFALLFYGAILLLVSLSVHFNLAAVVLEVCWGLIALVGLVKALSERRGRAAS